MIEYLNCDTCTAIVSTEMIECEYCGHEFRHSGISAELLKLRDDLDMKSFHLNTGEFLKYVNTSKFKDHPIVQFRKSKIQLIHYIHNDGILYAQEFCEILHTINNLKKLSEDYWVEFLTYISVTLPSSHSKLYLDDYIKIKNYLYINNLDKNGIISDKLKQQILITDLGVEFLKEYNYYTNPKNAINNQSFINKRQMLLDKYENFLITKKLI